jgi:hypothetical protein
MEACCNKFNISGLTVARPTERMKAIRNKLTPLTTINPRVKYHSFQFLIPNTNAHIPKPKAIVLIHVIIIPIGPRVFPQPRLSIEITFSCGGITVKSYVITPIFNGSRVY